MTIEKPSRKHPSGRPKHEDEYRRLSIPRPTYDEPLVAKLRAGATRDAIGFLHRIVSRDDDD